MNLLMVSGNTLTAQGKRDSFFYMLEEFSKYWNRIDVLCPPSSGATDRTVHGNVYFHPSPLSKLVHPLWIVRQGLKLARERSYHLMTIHEYPPFFNGLGGVMLSKRTGIPFISEFHHIEGYPKAANLEEYFRKLLSKIYVPWIAKRALRIRVINRNETPEFLLQHGVPPEKLIYLNSSFLELESFRPLSLPKEYDFVYCGRLVRTKGLSELIKALEICQRRRPTVKLLLIGAGPLEKKLKREVKRRNLEKNVVFWGWAKDFTEIGRLFNQSKVFVITSYAEGGPKTPLEAMACGIPIITTPVGLMKEIIRDGENGFLVSWSPPEIASRMMDLLENEGLRQTLIQNGLSLVPRFARKEIVGAYAAGYQSVLSAETHLIAPTH